MWLCLAAILGLVQGDGLCSLRDYGTYADCSARGLLNIPRFLPETITVLDVSHNTIVHSERSLPYPDLVSLNLSHCHINSISGVTFSQLHSLEELDISENNVKTLAQIDASKSFRLATSFKTLHLRRNPLSSIKFDPIWSDTLVTLDVSECNIKLLEQDLTLRWTPNLRRLVLNQNPLIGIDDLTSNSLEELVCVETRLQYIRHHVFESLPKLRLLDISGNPRLYSIAKRNPVASPSLEILRAQYCSFHSIEISGFPNLSELDLKGNRINSIQVEAFKENDKLVKVDLSRNWIKSIHPLAFSSSNSLLQLDLSLNQIEDVIDSLGNLDVLVGLNLSNNPLKTLLDVSKAYGLRILDVSHCDLKEIPSEIFNLRLLEVANFSRNSIHVLPDHLTSLTLKELDFSYNRLNRIGENWFRHFPILKKLSLQGNQLTEPIHSETLSRLNHVHFYLADNPWRCNCGEEDYNKFFSAVWGRGDSHKLTCQSPENVTGLGWKAACFRVEPRPESKLRKHAWLPTAVAAVSLLMVMFILVAVKNWSCLIGRRSPPTPQPPEPPQSVQPPPPPESRPPTYEEALLLPRPRTEARKSNADTQTAAPYLGSSRSLNSRTKHSMNRSLSSNSL